MKAVVYKGPYNVVVEEVADPQIEAPSDAIVRITTANICGSDLHMYEGRTSASEGTVLGHENMGIVEDVGSDVTRVRRGDRVSVPFNIACGTCRNCTTGWTSFCLRTNPIEGVDGAAYGYAQMGPYRGGQQWRSRAGSASTSAPCSRRASTSAPGSARSSGTTRHCAT